MAADIPQMPSAEPWPAQSRAAGLPRNHAAADVFRRRVMMGAICLAGLLVRGVALMLAPEHAFLSDHVDYMAWSQYAHEHGPTRLYDLKPGSLINAYLPPWLAERPFTTPYPSYNRCNYPPLANCAFWLQGLVWSLLDQHPVTLPPHPKIAEEFGHVGGPVTSRVANTFAARLANAFLAIVTDFLWAAGGALLLRRIRPQAPGLAVWAFGIALLAPPVFLNSAFWNQTDSWLACGMVWSVYLLATNRSWAAGVAYGVTALLKAQAVLLAPLLAYAFVGLAISSRGARQGRGLAGFLAGLLLTVIVLAAPFAVADRGANEMGWLRWAYRSYVEPIQSDFPYTTLKAFNVWWMDFVAHGGTEKALSARAVVLGMSKDALGRTVLGCALVVAALVCARRVGWSRGAWPLFAFFVLLAAFLFPTRVHERYIYYALPFVIIGALLFRPWLPVLIALLFVATFEMTWYLWYAPAYAAPWDPPGSPAAGAWSLLLALIALTTFAYALIAVWRGGAGDLRTRPADRSELP